LICKVATHEGTQIPRDIAVLGYGDHKIGRFAEFPVSTLGVFGEKVGSEAARLMSEILHKSSDAKQPTPLIDFGPAQLIVRDSTGGEAAGSRDRAMLPAHSANRVLGHHGERSPRHLESLPSYFSDKVSRDFWDSSERRNSACSLKCGKTNAGRKPGVYSGSFPKMRIPITDQFSNFFIRCTGVSPSEYRRR
jgi:hypothetical protein